MQTMTFQIDTRGRRVVDVTETALGWVAELRAGRAPQRLRATRDRGRGADGDGVGLRGGPRRRARTPACRATIATGTGTARRDTEAIICCRCSSRRRSRSPWWTGGSPWGRGSGSSWSIRTARTMLGRSGSASCRADVPATATADPFADRAGIASEVLAGWSLGGRAAGSGGHRLHVSLAQKDQILALELDLETGRRQEQDAIALLRDPDIGSDQLDIGPDEPARCRAPPSRGSGVPTPTSARRCRGSARRGDRRSAGSRAMRPAPCGSRARFGFAPAASVAGVRGTQRV